MEANIQHKKVLIVDDEKDLSGIVKSTLQSEGVEVAICDNAEIALQQGKEFKPDLILLDLMMPRLSGFEAIELFRTTLETKAAKIVVFSALSRSEDIERTKQLGADEYLVKSAVSFSTVIARIKELLSDSSSSDALVSDNGELKV